MPTYQYACTECQHTFEQVQSFSDGALTVCPECSGRLRKVFNAVGVVFKGSGFYRTDSRAGKSTVPATSDSSGSGGDSGSSGSDATPASSGSASGTDKGAGSPASSGAASAS